MNLNRGRAAWIAAITALSVLSFAQQPISVTINGQPVNFQDTSPREIGGRVLVPLRGVFEQLGAYVHWNDATQTVDATKGDTSVRLQIGNHYANVDGKNVYLDVPPRIIGASTMVPLRFVGEALGADVDWQALDRTVAITTAQAYSTAAPPPTPVTPAPRREPAHEPEHRERRIERHTLHASLGANTVIPVTLNDTLTSDHSHSGDSFTATLQTNGQDNYAGLPAGTTVQGHVVMARPREGRNPGVLQLAFAKINIPNGPSQQLDGSLIGLDSGSVIHSDSGVLQAKPGAKTGDTMVYVGYGAGAGAVLAALTHGNIITDALLGGALGLLFHELQKSQNNPKDVALNPGTQMGVRLNQQLILG